MQVFIRKMFKFTEDDKKFIETFIKSNNLSLKKFASLVGYPEAFITSVLNGKERCEKRFVNAVRRVLHGYNKENN